MRPVVSYDDITAPQDVTISQESHIKPSAPKKRKTHGRPANGRAQQQYQHWDDPGNNTAHMRYDETAADKDADAGMEDGEMEEDEEQSRELTHEEIWDDSALVDAWNSAMSEYEAYHGPGKKWKEEPVKKSPLWYNVPPSDNKTKGKAKVEATSAATGTHNNYANVEESNSAPLDFNTYVPAHDPSLASPLPPHPIAGSSADFAQYLQSSSGSIVSQDEAFSRALSAMYWAGYYTAVYHSHRHLNQGEIHDEVEDDGGEGETELDEDMLPAQR